MDCFPTLRVFLSTKWGKIVLIYKEFPLPSRSLLCKKQVSKREVAAHCTATFSYIYRMPQNRLYHRREESCALRLLTFHTIFAPRSNTASCFSPAIACCRITFPITIHGTSLCFYVYCLQITSALLLALDRFKQSLKVALAKRLPAFALDNLKKQCWTILYWFREKLQHIALVIPIDKNAILL